MLEIRRLENDFSSKRILHTEKKADDTETEPKNPNDCDNSSERKVFAFSVEKESLSQGAKTDSLEEEWDNLITLKYPDFVLG